MHSCASKAHHFDPNNHRKTSDAVCHKAGWWGYYTHDTGIVDGGRIKYIPIFVPLNEEKARPRLKMLDEKCSN